MKFLVANGDFKNPDKIEGVKLEDSHKRKKIN